MDVSIQKSRLSLRAAAAAALAAFAYASPIFGHGPAPYLRGHVHRAIPHKPLKLPRILSQRDAGFYASVNGLTGWQRNQWARAGYPGLRDKDAARVRPFAVIAKRGRDLKVAA